MKKLSIFNCTVKRVLFLSYALLISMNNVVFAATPPNPNAADAKWNAFIDFIVPWVSRLGGLLIFIGVIEFGIAFKSDDAEGKTKGIRFVIAGCIVFAVSMSSGLFLA